MKTVPFLIIYLRLNDARFLYFCFQRGRCLCSLGEVSSYKSTRFYKRPTSYSCISPEKVLHCDKFSAGIVFKLNGILSISPSIISGISQTQ